MATISVRIPEGITTKQAKALLVRAMDDRIDPVGSGSIKSVSAKISVNPIEFAKLSKFTKSHLLNVQDSASKLIQLQHIGEQKTLIRSKSLVHTFDFLVNKGVVDSRPGQREAISALRSVLTKNGVLMMEAPTGVGKTLAELCAAVDAIALNQDDLIVIAVPTIHLMHQVEDEYKLIQGAIKNAPDIGYIIGKNNFISLHKVAVILKDPENSQFVKPYEKWLKTAETDGLTISSLPYQADSLYDAIPDFPSCSIDSSTDETDPGMIAYRAQFLRAKDLDILIITHAMLAIDTKLKRINSLKMAKQCGEGSTELKKVHDEMVKAGDVEAKGYYEYLNDALSEYNSLGTLPRFSRLIVDEGHQLEQAFAKMTCDELSMYSLIRNDSIPIAVKVKLRKELVKIINKGKLLSTSDYISINTNPEVKTIIYAIYNLLCKVKKKNQELINALKVMKSVIENSDKPGVVSYIDFSPVYKYPRLRIGSKSVFMYLQYLWKSIDSGAAISATLLLPSVKGEWISSYTANLLGIPKELAREAHIAAPGWLTDPVTVFLPDILDFGGRHWLQPPSMPKDSKDKKAYEAAFDFWVDELCLQLPFIFDTAAGGTLVLLSSYDLAAKIVDRMGLFYQHRLVIADRDTPQLMQKNKFISLYNKGVNPIWIAVGGAWTGLNLKDELVEGLNAKEDLMLTDLVIPRLPLKMNQSITHEVRVLRFGWMMEVNETLMLVKQAMGRLVRREGILPNRRIFILDARIYQNSFATVRICFEKLISKYKKQNIRPGQV